MNISLLIPDPVSYVSGEWLYDLVKSRKNDKNGEYTKNEDYNNFISNSFDFSEAFKSFE